MWVSHACQTRLASGSQDAGLQYLFYHSVSFSYSGEAERLTLRDRELYGLPENDAGLGLQDWHREVDTRRFGPVSIE